MVTPRLQEVQQAVIEMFTKPPQPQGVFDKLEDLHPDAGRMMVQPMFLREHVIDGEPKRKRRKLNFCKKCSRGGPWKDYLESGCMCCSDITFFIRDRHDLEEERSSVKKFMLVRKFE